MIQDHRQCPPKKDHQHLKRRPQKSWTLFQDYRDAQDKQLTQYPFTPRSKWKMHQRYWKNPKPECPDIWIRLPRHKWPKSWSSMEDPVYPLERNLYGHPLAGLLWKGNSRKIFWNTVGNKFQTGIAYSLTEKEDLSVYVDDTKLAGKKQNISPTRKILVKDFDLGVPRSLLDNVYLGCTQRKCQISNDIVANCREMFESRISTGAKEKLPTRASGKRDAETISSRSYDMECHAKKCVERFENWRIKQLSNYIKSQRHA